MPVPTPFTTTLELDLAGHRQLLAFHRHADASAVLEVTDLSGDQQAAMSDLVGQFRGWCRDLAVTPLLEG